MKIAIGCDHGGINLKPILVKYLNEKGIEFKDFGTFDTNSIDYNDLAEPVCSAVANGEFDKGILICGTGIGISLAANKVKGVRAAVCSEAYSAQMTKLHNNANIISFGVRVVGSEVAKEIVSAWVNTEFEGGRHERRVNMIMDIENK